MTANDREVRVVAFTGLPGTGKSSLAERLAIKTGAPVFNGDWLMGALRPAHDQLSKLDKPTYLAMYNSLLECLISRQLMFGQSAVSDDILDDRLASRWQALADRYSARFYVVECVCTDLAEHRRRIERRHRSIPGWHEIGWDHVERTRADSAPLTVPRVTVDAMDTLDYNLNQIESYIGDTPNQ